MAQLRAAHHKGDNKAGLDMERGVVADVSRLGITESFKVKAAVLRSAAEAAEMVLRVDSIIRSAPRQREADPRMRGMN